jgi:methionyl-tRNA formyltransferase
VRFAFAGTPEFAAWVLKGLAEVGRLPALVVSQPDRPCGRGRRAATPPAVLEARRLGLACLQTENLNSDEMFEQLRAAKIDTLVVAAFGQILRARILESLDCLNIHASLLPDYRGAAPIQRAIADGRTRTGVTIMRITQALDSGPCALQKSVSIDLHDDAASIARTLAWLGAVGLDQVLTGMADGTATFTEQEGASTYAQKLTVVDSNLDINRPARSVHDQVRSLSPDIGARTSSGEVTFKVWRTWPFGDTASRPLPPAALDVAGDPGRIAEVGQRFFVGCAAGAVEILAVQPAGKGRMTTAEFLRGYRAKLGEELGRPAAPATEVEVEECDTIEGQS